MINIRNKQQYSEVRLFDPLTQSILIHSDLVDPLKIHGFFACLGGVQFVLYHQLQLMLSIGGTNHVFDDLSVSTNTVSRNVTQGQINLVRHIKIEGHNKIVFETDYDEISPMFEWDTTPFIEAEHFDFGLFLENLSKDNERCERLSAIWS